MTLPSSYKAGTITVSAGGTQVIGTGTNWTGFGVREGDIIWAGGIDVAVSGVVSATELQLAYPWPGPSLAGAGYEIRLTPDGVRVLAASREAIASIEDFRGDIYASSNVYPSTEAGLADALPGGQFLVKVGDELVRYRKDPGPVATELARYMTGPAVNAAVAQATAKDAALTSALRDGAIIPLTNIAGTGDAITADIQATMQNAGITSLSAIAEVEYVPVSTNSAANPTITIAGVTYGIRDGDGGTWPAGGFRVGYIYKLRRRGTTARVSGGMSYSELLATQALAVKNGSDLAVAAADAQSWPGDDAVLAEGSNGKTLVVKANGRVRGTFTADDVMGGLTQELLRTGEGDTIRDRLLNDGWPGDVGDVIVMAQNGIAVAVDAQGRLRGDIVIEASNGWPGDWIIEEVADARGVVLRGTDRRDGSDYAMALDVSGWPGDWIVGLEVDRTGRIIRGIDLRDQSYYPAGQSDSDSGSGGDNDNDNDSDSPVLDVSGWPGDWIIGLEMDISGRIIRGIDVRDQSGYPAGQSSGGGGGGSVEFVDPGFVGDAFGAVIDSNGVVKFQTIVAPGVPLGMEKRDGRFFADTHETAIAVLAIGGGDTGAASTAEDHPWHIFDEALEPQDTHTAASGLASAILTRQRRNFEARALMMPIAEVIGSTVEADVLAGASRRVQLMTRLQAAVDAAATWGKTLMVGWIKMDLLDGAPGTLLATAREHYGLVANGMRLESAEVTGQAAAPRPMVNQGFGTRTDGTSEVILAEGRLDWDFFSIGFIIPTPLYPFPLVPGTPATLTPEALLMVREIEAEAIAELGAGREWFCPSLEAATRAGSVITARFATLSGLVLRDPANHGFALSSGPAITSVTVSGSYATITLASAPTGPVVLNYAFGRTGDPGDGKPANRGSLTDGWSQASVAVPGQTLYRHARSGRITVN